MIQNSVVNLANMAVKKIMEKNGTLNPKITEEEKQCIWNCEKSAH